MRITREVLHKIAQETVDRRAREERNLLAAYLCGSLLGEEYLLGDTADVDLVFVHTDDVEIEREIVRLTDDVHLDIAHHGYQDYHQARRLRVHPWLGPTLNACKALYDPQHFLDFIQASVRGQYERVDHVLERAQWQTNQARRIWLDLQTFEKSQEHWGTTSYLKALGHAANAIASLSGPPLTERRFLLEFPQRAEQVKHAGLYAGILGLLGAPRLTPGALDEWLNYWDVAYQSLSTSKAPPRLHPDRRQYYLKAFREILEGVKPEAVLWPLLRTWAMAIGVLPAEAPHRQAWREAMAQLNLVGEALEERVEALDAYLDLVEEIIDTWGRQHGA